MTQEQPPVRDVATESMLTARDVARQLNVHVSTVYRLADSGSLKAHRIGGGTKRRRGLRIPESSVVEFLRSSRIEVA